MKIQDAKVIVTSPGRNFVTLKLTTDDGVVGLGDATLNGREQAVVSYLNDHVIPCLLGRDPGAIEDIWQYLYRGCYWRRGPVTMTAISAVDVALWDIKAKMAGMPLYQLLGGKSRHEVLVYGHANGTSIEEVLDEVARYRDLGYRAIRLQVGVPGVPHTYGVSRDKMFYEPADAELPTETAWSTPKYLDFVPRLFEAARVKFGFDVELLHDVHHRLTPIEAARLGRALEDYRLFWLEDPTVADNPESFRWIRKHTVTPLAVGEVFNSIYDAKLLMEEQLIDYIRMTIVHSGGISHMRKVASLAELYSVRTGCHGATDLSPVSMAAALHFGTAISNFGIQEYMRHSAETDEVFPHAYSYRNGALVPGETPGLGVDINEDLAGRYPYRRAYLPVCRLEDGTLFNW